MSKVNLHRRKTRALAPAQVRCGDDSITIVVPDIVGKNDSHTGGAGGSRFTSAATRHYRASALAGMALLRASGAPLFVFTHVCLWRLEVLGCWDRKRGGSLAKIGAPADAVVPIGDVDAAIPQAQDMLERAGVITNDAVIDEVTAWRCYRKGRHATVVRLSRLGAQAAPPTTRAAMEAILDEYLLRHPEDQTDAT